MRNMLLTIMLLISTGIFLLFWLSPPEVFLEKPVSTKEELPKADSYMLDIKKQDYGKTGAKIHSLEASEARHFRRGNRLELDRPDLITFNLNTTPQPWHMKADKGTILKGGKKAVFKGNVYAWQNINNKNKNELRTDRLVVFPDTHTAETESLVTITTPRGKTTGVGMQADLKNEQFKLLSKVKGVHRAL